MASKILKTMTGGIMGLLGSGGSTKAAAASTATTAAKSGPVIKQLAPKDAKKPRLNGSRGAPITTVLSDYLGN